MMFIYGMHVCIKRIIYPDIFFIFFQNFDFLESLGGQMGGEGSKNGLKWQKIMSVSLCISGTIHHMIVVYGTHV